MPDAHQHPPELERAQRQLLARRLPLFALAWLAVTVVWAVALTNEASELGRAATGLVIAQLLALGTLVGLRGRISERTAAGIIVLVLGTSWTLFFLVFGGQAIVLNLLHVALCLTAGTAFAWGWRVQLLLMTLVLGPALAIDSRLEQHMPPLQSAAALTMGALILVGTAEISSRRVRRVVLDLAKRTAAENALRTSLVELRASEEKLRQLARRQTTVREEERKRLGLDLHDDVCQELVGVTILLESARRSLRAGEPAREPLARAIRYVAEVVDHVRGLARDLRPLHLQDLGLVGTLRSLAEGMSSSTMLVEATFPTEIARLHEDTELGVYRVAQEAVANAARHSGARRIELMLTAADGRLRLEVSDDGCGFVATHQRGSALGLASMEERALAIGGHLRISSTPGNGTTVHLDCPLRQAARASAA